MYVFIYLSIPCCTRRKYISNSTMKVDIALHIQIVHVRTMVVSRYFQRSALMAGMGTV